MKLDSRAPTLPYYRNLLPVFPPNVLARQGETKFFLLSLLSLVSSYSLIQCLYFQIRFISPQIAYP